MGPPLTAAPVPTDMGEAAPAEPSPPTIDIDPATPAPPAERKAERSGGAPPSETQADPGIDVADAAPGPSNGPKASTPHREPSGQGSVPRNSGQGGAPEPTTNETIRVKLSRIDLLIQRIGELAVHQQLLSGRVVELTDDPELEADSRKLGQLASESHDIAMSLRMVPIQPVVRALRRTCRDTALKLDKKVNFVTEGEDTELDLALVQTTSDALMHLVRNAVDHGVETRQERAQTDKPEAATVMLGVAQRGGHIEIVVSDDGRGIDTERIKNKALKLGWIAPDDTPTQEALFDLLFKPGFSTATSVTEFSGRGVGLDVVATSIAALDGSITVHSELGHGSTIRVSVPLSVAVVDVMRVQISGDAYLVPLHTIQETVAVSPDELRTTAAGASTVLLLRGQPVPIHVLSDVLSANASVPDISSSDRTSALVTRWRSRPIAFIVDDIEGRQQVVIKPLGPELSHISGISGSAILGDGRVGLILDLSGLISARGIAAA